MTTESDITADDERQCANGWIERKTHFDVGVCGNAALYFGRKFKFKTNHIPQQLPAPYMSDVEMSEFQTALIASIVSHVKDGKDVLCFKIFDADKHRTPPSQSSKEWCYVPCQVVMCEEQSKCIVELVPIYKTYPDGVTQHNLKKRRVCKFFADTKRFYRGVVVEYNEKADLYNVVYQDGDYEDLTLDELIPILRC